MKKTIYLSKAIQIWICVICAIIIVGIYPLRLFRRTVTVGESSAPRVISQVVNDEHSIRQYFVAQYNKIDSVSVYVSSIEGGRYMAIALQKNGYSSVCSRYIDLQNENIPGYVTVPLGVELEPGERYNLLFIGNLSAYYIAHVRFDEDTPPGMETYLYDQNPVAGVRLAAQFTYDLPISKAVSLVLMGVVFLAGVILCFLTTGLFRKKVSLNKLIMTGDAVFYPLAVVLLCAFSALFILNFPLRVFDQDPLEISFYAVGIFIGGVVSLYALYRFCREERRLDALRGREWIAAVFMALAIKYGCDYMNGTYNLAHYISARQMIICLLLMAVCLLPIRILIHPFSLLLAAAGTIGSALWAKKKWIGPEEDLAEALNLETKLTVAVVILTVYIISCLLLQTIRIRRHKMLALHEGSIFAGGRKIPWYLILTLVTAVMLVVYRNTRVWIPVLVALYTIIYLSAREKVFAGRWFLIVQNGVLIHFLASLGYCLLHRGFQMHVFNRYGFVFSTVTVTAQYMTMVCSVAAAALLNRMRDYREGRIEGKDNRRGVRGLVRALWRELVFFGVSCSYMLFSISRQSTVAVFVVLIVLLLLIFFLGLQTANKQASKSDRRVFIKNSFMQLLLSVACLIVSVTIIFPAAFTLQRTIPSLYGEQHLLPEIEEVTEDVFYKDGYKSPPFILGKAGLDSAAYIRIKRFYHIFTNRILGMKEVFNWYRFDPNNYDENQFQEYWINGDPLPDWYKELKDKAAAGNDNPTSDENVTDEATEATGSLMIGDNATNDAAADDKVESVSMKNGTASEEEIKDEEKKKAETESVEEEYSVDISNGRFEIFQSYINNLNMTGHPEMTNENTVGPHAHNIYLQTAFDCGIPTGILFFLWTGFTILDALIQYIWSVRRQSKDEIFQAATYLTSIAVSLGFVIIGMFDLAFMLANPPTVIFLMSIAPLVVCSGRMIKN